jgi:hypothetical protein
MASNRVAAAQDVLLVDIGSYAARSYGPSGYVVLPAAVVPNGSLDSSDAADLSVRDDAVGAQTFTVPITSRVRRPCAANAGGHLHDLRTAVQVLEALLVEHRITDERSIHLVFTVKSGPVDSAPVLLAELALSQFAFAAVSVISTDALVTLGIAAAAAASRHDNTTPAELHALAQTSGHCAVIDLGHSQMSLAPYIGFKRLSAACRQVHAGGFHLTRRLEDHIAYTQVRLDTSIELLSESVKHACCEVWPLASEPLFRSTVLRDLQQKRRDAWLRTQHGGTLFDGVVAQLRRCDQGKGPEPLMWPALYVLPSPSMPQTGHRGARLSAHLTAIGRDTSPHFTATLCCTSAARHSRTACACSPTVVWSTSIGTLNDVVRPGPTGVPSAILLYQERLTLAEALFDVSLLGYSDDAFSEATALHGEASAVANHTKRVAAAAQAAHDALQTQSALETQLSSSTLGTQPLNTQRSTTQPSLLLGSLRHGRAGVPLPSIGIPSLLHVLREPSGAFPDSLLLPSTVCDALRHNVVLYGGTAAMPGMCLRVAAELRAIAPCDCPVHVTHVYQGEARVEAETPTILHDGSLVLHHLSEFSVFEGAFTAFKQALCAPIDAPSGAALSRTGKANRTETAVDAAAKAERSGQSGAHPDAISAARSMLHSRTTLTRSHFVPNDGGRGATGAAATTSVVAAGARALEGLAHALP